MAWHWAAVARHWAEVAWHWAAVAWREQGMVKQWQDLFYAERYSGTEQFNPDFVKLAEVRTRVLACPIVPHERGRGVDSVCADGCGAESRAGPVPPRRLQRALLPFIIPYGAAVCRPCTAKAFAATRKQSFRRKWRSSSTTTVTQTRLRGVDRI